MTHWKQSRNKVQARSGCQYRSCLSCTSIMKHHFDITADSKGDNTNASLRVTAQHWICSLQTIQRKWFIFNQWLGSYSCFCQFHLAGYQLQNSCEFKLVTWKNILIMLAGVLPSMQCIWINSPESFPSYLSWQSRRLRTCSVCLLSKSLIQFWWKLKLE